MNRLAKLAPVALCVLLLSLTAEAQNTKPPAAATFSFLAAVGGRFKAPLRLLDEDGKAPVRIFCTHSLWASYKYGSDPMSTPRRLITIEANRNKIVFNVTGMPGIRRSGGQRVAMYMMIRSHCDETNINPPLEIDSTPSAQYVECGEGSKYPADRVVKPAKWLSILRNKLLMQTARAQ